MRFFFNLQKLFPPCIQHFAFSVGRNPKSIAAVVKMQLFLWPARLPLIFITALLPPPPPYTHKWCADALLTTPKLFESVWVKWAACPRADREFVQQDSRSEFRQKTCRSLFSFPDRERRVLKRLGSRLPLDFGINGGGEKRGLCSRKWH